MNSCIPPCQDGQRIGSIHPVISPALLIAELTPSVTILNTVSAARTLAQKIVHQQDDRLLVIVGPCSIHDPAAALEYGRKLQPLIAQYHAQLCIIMRVYFAKPRTIHGWKGFINDPHLNQSYDIPQGLRRARQLLLELTALGIPCGTEFLDTIACQFIADLIAWSAIGARTAQSTLHRELASGLSMPVGFKNNTDGNVQIAIDAACFSRHPQHFLSVAHNGSIAVVSTLGNPDTHVILRGADSASNFDAQTIASTTEKLRQANLDSGIMVDCSHGNSAKDHRKQSWALDSVANQISQGNHAIIGVMLESYLSAGRQDLIPGQKPVPNLSITDACIGWEETTRCLKILAQAAQARRIRATP